MRIIDDNILAKYFATTKGRTALAEAMMQPLQKFFYIKKKKIKYICA